MPPARFTPKSTMMTSATVMKTDWMRSVVDTARKPPSTV